MSGPPVFFVCGVPHTTQGFEAAGVAGAALPAGLREVLDLVDVRDSAPKHRILRRAAAEGDPGWTAYAEYRPVPTGEGSRGGAYLAAGACRVGLLTAGDGVRMVVGIHTLWEQLADERQSADGPFKRELVLTAWAQAATAPAHHLIERWAVASSAVEGVAQGQASGPQLTGKAGVPEGVLKKHWAEVEARKAQESASAPGGLEKLLQLNEAGRQELQRLIEAEQHRAAGQPAPQPRTPGRAQVKRRAGQRGAGRRLVPAMPEEHTPWWEPTLRDMAVAGIVMAVLLLVTGGVVLTKHIVDRGSPERAVTEERSLQMRTKGQEGTR